MTQLPQADGTPSVAPPSGGSTAKSAAADPLTQALGAILKPAASAATAGVAKTAAVWYGSTLAIVVAVLDLKFHLGLSSSFDAGLIGAALSALLGHSLSL